MGKMTQKTIRLVRNRPELRRRVDRISKLIRCGLTKSFIPDPIFVPRSFARSIMLAMLEVPPMPLNQGLTLVHFSAQRKRFLWDRGCI